MKEGTNMTKNQSNETVTFNVINKKVDESSKYYDYKETLRTFLSKKCFTKDENIATFENFHKNYTDFLELKLSVAIDKLKVRNDLIYKELLLTKSFEGSVCTFSLDQKIKNMKKAGYLELICDDKRVMRKHFKDVSKAILSTMRIKSTDVLFNGNAAFVKYNLEISKSMNASFIVTL